LSDKFTPVPFPQLTRLVLGEIKHQRLFGIPGSLFYFPRSSDPFGMNRYGKRLITPIGVASGPHTQLTLNIVAAWLCGARYVELKTIQTLDELTVSKPCIDMQDEGYNCEWSQELKVEQSFHEYLNAWILIHILHRELAFHGPVGTLFNMSVGYNLDGILQEKVQGFFKRMQDCTIELEAAKDSIRNIYPGIDDIEIPSCISNHVTLSTMHGCPPHEIEKIGRYLLLEKKLHTTIKLNPTLLGPDELRGLLNGKLGFSTQVPDSAFDHDLKYPDALKIIESLISAAGPTGLQCGVKLTNTLETVNHKTIFSQQEKMMYMSGRALHPVSINLAKKLQNDFSGMLDISFSGGVDCFNIADVLACGLKPVTFCSDLLKPGGYGRLWQTLDHLRKRFSALNAGSPDEFIILSSGDNKLRLHEASRVNLTRYSAQVADNPSYHKQGFSDPDIKTKRPLSWFDCIHAPCKDTCPTNQDIPGYMYRTAYRDFLGAFDTIFKTNPFPSVTGMICDHPCQIKCTRINYDEPLHIRDIKRFIAEKSHESAVHHPEKKGKTSPKLKAAIIGAGPAGLSCAWFLNLAGFEVHVFEQKKITGGMVSAAIPSFRLTGQAIERDIQRILNAGIVVHDNFSVNQTNFGKIRKEHNLVFIAAGAQSSILLDIEGILSPGVLDPLAFLFAVKNEKIPVIGHHIVIIGGGNTAMDAARTASRLVGPSGKVTIAYRRTRREMPADKGEIKAVQEEGIEIVELVNPEKVKTRNDRVTGLLCSRNTLVTKEKVKGGKDNRPKPVKVDGSEFEIPCDTIIPAIGQKLYIDFLEEDMVRPQPGSYKTQLDHVYIGGDAMRGASTAINAIADGRKAAIEIVSDFGGQMTGKKPENQAFYPDDKGNQPDKDSKEIGYAELIHKKAIRAFGPHPIELPLDQRKNFNLVMSTFSDTEAREEASRCLYCDELCNICVTVCPNLANFCYPVEPVCYHLQKAVRKQDGSIGLEDDNDFRIDQPYQVLNIRDLCNECGNCVTFCPSSGRPYMDKPGLSLSIASFNRENEGFLISHLPERDILIYKEKEQVKTLYLQNGKYYFETGQVKAVLDEITFRLIEVNFLVPCVKEYHFTFAAEMSIILMGIRSKQ